MSFMRVSYHLCCDLCQIWDENLFGETKNGARRLSKKCGWVSIYVHGKLKDFCPECKQEAQEQKP